MTRQPDKANGQAAERAAIRRRVKQLYEWFNREQWERCFEVVDPKLRDAGRIRAESYTRSLSEFKEFYGVVRIWYMRISLHLAARGNKHDDRPFAYVYVVWQDDQSAFHMFRERWVKDAGRWYTRVVGLVPDREPARNRKHGLESEPV
jgi:hypothetical protein